MRFGFSDNRSVLVKERGEGGIVRTQEVIKRGRRVKNNVRRGDISNEGFDVYGADAAKR